ncbi:MAG: SH3 domain-containing protein [Anaerolineae bacterium]|nr:SH3 domain-containing protein [Anaerolineae bacterium]
MKIRLLVLLTLLAVLAFAVTGLTSAQESVQIKAVTLGAAGLYADASAEAEMVAEIPAYAEVSVLATNVSGDWIEVDAAEGAGFVMASDLLVLNIPALAPKMMVATASAGATSLFAVPDLSGEFIGGVPDGTVATLLGVDGEWAYVEMEDGARVWSIASSWGAMPEGAYKALVNAGNMDSLGVFAEASINAALAGTVADGGVVTVLAMADDTFSEVMAADGSTGYVLSGNLSALPAEMIETASTGQAKAGIYAAPEVTADILATLDNGVVMTYMGEVDEYWIEVYHPKFGMVYGLKVNFGNVFFVAENQTDEAIVRAGPSSFTNPAVAQLPKGAMVVVTGVNEDGTWLKVALPFSEVDFSENGVDGWMADFLFQDLVGAMTVDTGMLSVVD